MWRSRADGKKEEKRYQGIKKGKKRQGTEAAG